MDFEQKIMEVISLKELKKFFKRFPKKICESNDLQKALAKQWVTVCIKNVHNALSKKTEFNKLPEGLLVLQEMYRIIDSLEQPIQFKNGYPTIHLLLTKDLALLLYNANPYNRSINKRHAESLIKLIKKKEYEDHGDHVEISFFGTLINGQHRTHAILLSEGTYLTLQLGKDPKSVEDRDTEVCVRTSIDNAIILDLMNEGTLITLLKKAKGQIKLVLGTLAKELEGVPICSSRFSSSNVTPKQFANVKDEFYEEIFNFKSVFMSNNSRIRRGAAIVGFLKFTVKHPDLINETIEVGEGFAGTKDLNNSLWHKNMKFLRESFLERYPSGKGDNQVAKCEQYGIVLYTLHKTLIEKKEIRSLGKAEMREKIAKDYEL